MPLYRGHHPFPLRLCQSAFASVCDGGSERLGSTACRRSPGRIANSTQAEEERQAQEKQTNPPGLAEEEKEKEEGSENRLESINLLLQSFHHPHSFSQWVGRSVSQSFLPSIAVRIIIVPTFKPGLLRSNCCCACPRHPGASQADQALISDSGTEDCLPAQGHRRMGAEDSRAEKSS